MCEHVYAADLGAGYTLALQMEEMHKLSYLYTHLQLCTADPRAQLHRNLRIKNSHFFTHTCARVCVCACGITVL